jgi:hypothetical protein
VTSTTQTHFANFNNGEVVQKVDANFPNSVQDFSIENVNGFTVRNSHDKDAVIFRRWKFQDIRESHIAGD